MEIDKLFALNTTNLEIHKRLLPFQNDKGEYHLYSVQKLSVRDNCRLELDLKVSTIGPSNFVSCFEKVNNLFNDALPSSSYLDLRPALTKYTLLDAKKVEPFATLWKNALEQVQVVLGALESQIVKVHNDEERIFSLLNIKPEAISGGETKLVMRLAPKPNNRIKDLQFEITKQVVAQNQNNNNNNNQQTNNNISDNTKDGEMESLIKIVMDNYDVRLNKDQSSMEGPSFTARDFDRMNVVFGRSYSYTDRNSTKDRIL